MVKTFKAQCNFLPSNGNQEVKHHSMNSVLSSIDMWQSHVHPDPSSPWSLYSSHLYKKQQARDNNPSVSVKNEQQCLMSDCKLHAHVIRNTYKGKWLWQACTQVGGGGGYSWEFLVGLCHPVVQILTLFQTKNCNFPHLFSDQSSKIHTHFQTWPLGRNYVIIT